MKYPKLWDGPSPVGESHTRALERTNAPYLSIHGANSVAYKKGQFREVRKDEPQTYDGYYSLGDSGDPDIITVRASPTARGTFAFRGTQGGVDNFAAPALNYIGRGAFVVPKDAGSPAYFRLYKTHNGRTFTDMDVLFGPIAIDYNQPSSLQYLKILHTMGLYRPAPGAEAVQHFGVSFLYDLQQDPPVNSIPAYAFYRNGEWVQGAPLTYVGGGVGTPNTWQWLPARILSFTPSYTYTTEFGPIGPPFFSRSNDMGETWVALSSGSVFTALMALHTTARTFDVADGFTDSAADIAERRRLLYNWQHGAALMTDLMTGAPLSPDTFVTPMPIIDSLEWNTVGDPDEGIPYRALTISSGGAISDWGELPFRYPDDYPAQCFHFGGAVYAQVITATAHQLYRTTTGTSWALHATLPFASKNTGYMSFDDTDVMMLPVYDGDYSLYQSKDTGLTWTKRGTICKGTDAPAPSPTGRALARYGVLNFARSKYSAADPFPQAPWIGNSDRTYAP